MTASSSSRTATMPSDVNAHLGPFDRFASVIGKFASRAWFFVLCVLLVVLWAPSFLILPSIDSWQLVINTATTVVTFLLVALLQNTQKRSDDATQHKLNAIASGLCDLMAHLADVHPQLHRDCVQLRKAVGLEDHESAA